MEQHFVIKKEFHNFHKLYFGNSDDLMIRFCKLGKDTHSQFDIFEKNNCMGMLRNDAIYRRNHYGTSLLLTP